MSKEEEISSYLIKSKKFYYKEKQFFITYCNYTNGYRFNSLNRTINFNLMKFYLKNFQKKY